MYSAVQSGAEMTQLLILSGAQVNKATSEGVTPLYRALGMGALDVCKILINHPDININQADHKGGTPLMQAAIVGSTEIARLLLGHPDIDMNASAPPNGGTALNRAAITGHTEIARLLRAADGKLSIITQVRHAQKWTLLREQGRDR